MTLTSRSMEWLDQNRHRSYPLDMEEWRAKVPHLNGLDCVLLDALLFDQSADGSETMSVESVSVGQQSTSVRMKYAQSDFSVVLSGGSTYGKDSYDVVRGKMTSSGGGKVNMYLVFSSHSFIKENVGTGNWDVGCNVLGTRVIRLSMGRGVSGISSNGSSGVASHDSPSVSSGDILLEDGYRTSPIIHRGRVLVRVGRGYGYNPCKYDFGEDSKSDCGSKLLFFCGQKAANGGNMSIKGGVGIGVSQGRSYDVRTGTCAGKSIPCIEISAGRELMDMYRPIEA